MMADIVFILSTVGFTLIVVGFGLLVYGFIWNARRSGLKGRFGGLVLIGPFPIVFGSSRGMVRLMTILSIVLIALFIAFWTLPLLFGGV